MPHVHLSGIHAVGTILVIIAAFGSLHLLAASYPSSTLAQAWLGLGF